MIADLLKAASARQKHGERYGQAVFNAAYALAPERALGDALALEGVDGDEEANTVTYWYVVGEEA